MELGLNFSFSSFSVDVYYGHGLNTYYSKCCVSPCGSYLLSGSNNENAYIWLTDSPGYPIATLGGHFEEVTSVSWSSLDKGLVSLLEISLHNILIKYFYFQLVTCSDDMAYRIFRVSPGSVDSSDIAGQAKKFVTPEKTKLSSLKALVSTPRRSSRISTVLTPRTSEKKFISDWLSGSKDSITSSRLTPQTPESSKSLSVSISKRQTLKRKLTDIMEGDTDQENQDKRRAPTSPSTSEVLSEVGNIPSQGAAKMLRWEGAESIHSDRLKTVEEESFTVDEEKESLITDKISFFGRQTSVSSESPMKTSEQKEDKFWSPTANLPNFVVDGRSPHSRTPSSSLTPKRRDDWLTCLRLRKSASKQTNDTETKSPSSSRASKSRPSSSSKPKTSKPKK